MTRWIAVVFAVAGCGGSPIYAECEEPDDCHVPDEVTAECLDKYGRGFCTWRCSADDECAWDEDEYARVCASFESEDRLYCFPSCEGAEDESKACPDGFGCRSTGGGNDNRKVCFPEEDGGSEPGDPQTAR
jgi:hypothetical protein